MKVLFDNDLALTRAILSVVDDVVVSSGALDEVWHLLRLPKNTTEHYRRSSRITGENIGL